MRQLLKFSSKCEDHIFIWNFCLLHIFSCQTLSVLCMVRQTDKRTEYFRIFPSFIPYWSKDIMQICYVCTRCAPLFVCLLVLTPSASLMLKKKNLPFSKSSWWLQRYTNLVDITSTSFGVPFHQISKRWHFGVALVSRGILINFFRSDSVFPCGQDRWSRPITLIPNSEWTSWANQRWDQRQPSTMAERDLAPKWAWKIWVR